MADEKDGKTTTPKAEDIAAATLEFEKYVERQKESIRIERERLQIQGQFVEAFSKQFSMQEKTVSALAESLDDLEDQFAELSEKDFKQLIDSMLEAATSAGVFGSDLEELTEFLNNFAKSGEMTADQLKKMQLSLHRASRKLNEAEKSTRGLESSITSLAGGFNLGLTSSTGFASSLLDMTGHINTLMTETENFSFAQLGLAMAGEAAIGTLNKLGNNMAIVRDEFAKGAAAIAKATGAAQQSVLSFANLADGLLALGTSSDQIASTVDALTNSTSLLGNEINNSEIGSVQLASKLVALGMDANSLAGTINLLTRGFGMSLDQSTEFLESLVLNSRVAGQSIGDLSKNFQEAESRLAVTARTSSELALQFEGLNRLAKETGTSVGGLISVARGFDKFGDAADKVGKLNAQFNLGLSMTQMMRASDEERIRLIREAFNARGIQADMLGKYEKLHIQSILNAKDDAEMMKILGQSRAGESTSMRTLNELLEAQQGVYDRLKNALKEFAANFAPLIAFMTVLTGLLADFISYAAEFNTFGSVLASIGIAVVVLGGAVGALVVSLGLFKKAMQSAPETAEKVGKSISSVGNSFARVLRSLDTKKILALGAAFMMTGIGLGAAGVGFAELAKGIALLGPGQALAFVTSLALISAAVIGFSFIMLKFLPMTLASLGLFAGGMAVVAAGLYGVGVSIKMIFDSIGSAAKELGVLADGSFATLITGLNTLAGMESPLGAMVEDLASLNEFTSDMDGLIISQVSEGKRTVMMASENILKGKAENSIDVNVKISMDDLNVENLNTVHVFLDGEKLAENVAKRMEG